MNRNLLWLCVSVTILVSACASTPKTSPPPIPTTPPRENSSSLIQLFNNSDDELLGYAKRFGEMSAESQKKEMSQLQLEIARNKGSQIARIQLAIAYSLPSSRYRDLPKATALTDELLRDKSARSDITAMAWVLRDFIGEYSKLGQKARDEQKRAETLQQKLDGLRNIEKTMGDRDQGLSK